MLLGQKGIAINAVDIHGHNEFTSAIMGGNNRTAALLRNVGVDADIIDNKNRSAIDIAKGEGFEDIATALENEKQ